MEKLKRLGRSGAAKSANAFSLGPPQLVHLQPPHLQHLLAAPRALKLLAMKNCNEADSTVCPLPSPGETPFSRPPTERSTMLSCSCQSLKKAQAIACTSGQDRLRLSHNNCRVPSFISKQLKSPQLKSYNLHSWLSVFAACSCLPYKLSK